MRSHLVAALALAASACCFDFDRDDACVVAPFPTGAYCYTVGDDGQVCTYDDADDPPPLYSGRDWCDGTLYENDTCADHGFTEGCPGDIFVRSGTRC